MYAATRRERIAAAAAVEVKVGHFMIRCGRKTFQYPQLDLTLMQLLCRWKAVSAVNMSIN
jgi:hypothetical protein